MPRIPEGMASVSAIDRIRQKVRDRDYYLSSHAEEEMVDDGFERIALRLFDSSLKLRHHYGMG